MNIFSLKLRIDDFILTFKYQAIHKFTFKHLPKMYSIKWARFDNI